MLDDWLDVSDFQKYLQQFSNSNIKKVIVFEKTAVLLPKMAGGGFKMRKLKSFQRNLSKTVLNFDFQKYLTTFQLQYQESYNTWKNGGFTAENGAQRCQNYNYWKALRKTFPKLS